MKNTRGSEWNKWDLHIHTASSYDSPYKADDADELLCQALAENDIKAVAITDHFKIDKTRIEHLRKLAPEIVFFPGVELRTDKGANNLHLILIFSELSDLETLSADFNAIMLRTLAKSKESDETIYWQFDDIVEFCKNHGGLISIHAGKKSNGIDKEISNALPVKEAIKSDIAKHVDFFEVGKKKDIVDYYKYVFKEIDEKPIILCSDCHDPRKYSAKESLWIKANVTFEGLKQCIFQPSERVYVGTIPAAVDRVNKNKKANIDSLSVHRIIEPKNDGVSWFDFDISLNAGLVAVIGNKGSGKSAFSDIIGQVCKCRTMGSASFLNDNRFRKMPKNLASDYIAEIKWKDGHLERKGLDVNEFETVIEDAQYLPQKYIEDVCNDIGNIFQEEIDKVIYSYVDRTERGSAANLAELVKNKSQMIQIEMEGVYKEIERLNECIIRLERKKTSQYRLLIVDSLKKYQEILERHEKNKPQEIKKPDEKEENIQYQEKLKEIDKEITELNQKVEQNRDELTKINEAIGETEQIIAKLRVLRSEFGDIKEELNVYLKKYQLEIKEDFCLKDPLEIIEQYKNKLITDKTIKQLTLNGSPMEKGLLNELKIAHDKKNDLISTSDIEEKKYQKYLNDLQDWEKEKQKIIGSQDTEDCLTYYKSEKEYLDNILETDYHRAREERNIKFKELFVLKQRIVIIYQEIYAPIEQEIKKLLGDLEETIEFQAEMQLMDNDFSNKILSSISQRFAGVFKGKTEANNRITRLLRSTEFSDENSVLDLVNSIILAVDEDMDNSEKKITDKKEFYDYLYGLEYVGVSFKLKMGGRDLEELSPGERGIVLLIFYLALSQNSIPIIIDQPEDNLDNQSVYNKLVPCICAAKQKRQVIIVTHNPNIAVACDAEQIICCKMDKNTHKITYLSGAIEDQEIKQNVVDILEGTMPAFDLRRRKYV